MTKVTFHAKKFATNRAKVAAFLGMADVDQSFFERLASLVMANAEFVGQGSSAGSTMYVAETKAGFMVVSVNHNGFWDGTNGVTLFGHYRDFDRGIKSNRADIMRLVKRQGLRKAK